MMQVKFRSDTKHRKEWLTGLHFVHPAKMHLSLQLWLINRYTKPGDVILDCMAGSGTILLACSLGRNVIAVELEDKFVSMMEGNWQKIQERGPQLGYQMGQATILQGDARDLEGVCDQIITSPPYGDDNANLKARGDKSASSILATTGMRGEQLSTSNIGNLKSHSYLSAMALVYSQCHKVLKDNGLMILVLKNFIRDRKIVRLDLDTIRLCEQAGFRLEERHYRKLTQQSFWRTIQLQKCDHRRGSKQNPKCTLGLSCPVQQAKQADMFGKTKDGQAMESLCLHYVNTSPKLIQEDILVFRKDGSGGIVDEVVMSPPYALDERHRRTFTAKSDSSMTALYGKADGQIANLPYGEIDKVI